MNSVIKLTVRVPRPGEAAKKHGHCECSGRMATRLRQRTKSKSISCSDQRKVSLIYSSQRVIDMNPLLAMVTKPLLLVVTCTCGRGG